MSEEIHSFVGLDTHDREGLPSDEGHEGGVSESLKESVRWERGLGLDSRRQLECVRFEPRSDTERDT